MAYVQSNKENETSKVDVQIEKAQSIINLYTTAVIYPGPSQVKPIDFGSGTFVSIAGKKGILTNWHVAKIFIERNANRVTVPYSDAESTSLAIGSIVYLPPQVLYPDVAFIELRDSSADEWKQIMYSLGKQFFDFDSAVSRYTQTPYWYQENVSCLWLMHGLVAEGMKPINDRATFYYKNSNPYIVVPDFNHIEYMKYDYGRLGILEVDIMPCPIKVENRKSLPKKFCGISGAALWRISFDQDQEVENVGLVGLATVQDMLSDSLICQGPTALYNTFYKFICGQYNRS